MVGSRFTSISRPRVRVNLAINKVQVYSLILYILEVFVVLHSGPNAILGKGVLDSHLAVPKIGLFHVLLDVPVSLELVDSSNLEVHSPLSFYLSGLVMDSSLPHLVGWSLTVLFVITLVCEAAPWVDFRMETHVFGDHHRNTVLDPLPVSRRSVPPVFLAVYLIVYLSQKVIVDDSMFRFIILESI